MAPVERGIEKGERVLVTGASGFIGSHVVGTLLSRGYRVRGSVRDPSDTKKTAHLGKLAAQAGAADALELVAADLEHPGAFDDAVRGCPWVCHVASTVKLRADDPQREIVDVAVEGTKNVLGSVARASEVRRVVLTSSIAAVVDESKPLDFVFDESSWNESSTVSESPYPLSKALAEKAAWAFVEALPEAERFSLVTMSPTFVLGPVLTKAHGRSSPGVIRDLLTGKFPLVPNFHWGIVDVRDVALGHVLALEMPEAEGRHILNEQGAWLVDMAKILREAFPGKKVPRWRMPDFAMYGVALFDKRLTRSFLRRNLGVARRIDASKSREALKLHYRPLEDTLRDTARSFIDLQLA